MAGVGGACDLDKAEGTEGGLVFGQLDPGLQFQRGQMQGAGPGIREGDQPPREPPAPVGRGHGKLADVKRLRFRGEEDAGDGGMAENPDLTRPRLQGDAVCGQGVHRGGRVDATVHEGEFGLDKGQEGWPVEGLMRAVRGHARRVPRAAAAGNRTAGGFEIER